MREVDTITEVSKRLGISREELVIKGVLSFLKKEIRLAEEEIAHIREKYNVKSKKTLYKKIKSKEIASHPAWEDYLTWKNKERYIQDLQAELKSLR